MNTNPVYKDHRHALPGPDDITRKELPNGIIVLSRPNFNSPTLSIKGYIHSGCYFDPDEKLGLGYLTAHGLMNGTLNHDFQSLYNEIESVGARLSFSAGTLTTAFSAHCLSEDLTLILNLIAESLRTPTFPEKEFNRQKTQLLTGLAIRAQDTAAMAALIFDQIIYAGHPYERPEEGYTETVQRITREDIINFYQQTYGPRKMVVVVVGAVEPYAAVNAVSEALGDWHNPSQRTLPEIPEAQSIQNTSQKTLSIPGKAQADIVLGSLAPERLSPDYHDHWAANRLTVGGGYSDRDHLCLAGHRQMGVRCYPGAGLSGGSKRDAAHRVDLCVRQLVGRCVLCLPGSADPLRLRLIWQK